VKRFVIIGGGIAGLSAAYYLRKRLGADDGTRIVVLEASERWGGKITTERVQFEGGQFIVEGGPDTFLATKPYATALCKELGLGTRLHGTNPVKKNTYVLHRGQLLPLPDGLAMMIPTNVQAILKSRLVSWPSKARMGLDFILPAKPVNGDESLGAFVSRRLGREAYENLIEPLMSGIYAGDGDALSLASTFPYMRDLELKYGSLARGALTMRKSAKSSNGGSTPGSRSAFLTPTTGLAEIVEALVAWLQKHGVELRLGTLVQSIEQNRNWQIRLADGEVIEAEGLILATPAFVSGSLLGRLDEELGEALKKIPYASTATISLAYRLSDVPRPLDGYGYVIPRSEGREALACTWTSTKFPHRAPDRFALIRVFVGRAGEDIPWDEEKLTQLARAELRQTLGIEAEPLLARVFMWEKAMPQYNLGHPQLLEKIDAAVQRHPGLALAGNGFRGIGIPDCIHSGELAAERILNDQTVGSPMSKVESHASEVEKS
jgi:protoporphyrinogen/coproporphyrinogen III oxidase